MTNKLVRRGFNDLIDDVFSWDTGWPFGLTFTSTLSPMIGTDVNVTKSEDNDNVYFRAVVPGYTQDNLKVQIQEGGITISGNIENESEEDGLFSSEKKSFSCRYMIPEDIEIDKINSELKNGILVVTFPKVPETARRLKAREIPILAETNKEDSTEVEVT